VDCRERGGGLDGCRQNGQQERVSPFTILALEGDRCWEDETSWGEKE
jgi:hypothetical protein